MSDTFIEEIKKRAEAATPGPCEVIRFDRENGDISYQVESGFGKNHVILGAHFDLENPKAKADAYFEAHARTDIPKLLALVELYEKTLIEYSDDNIYYNGGYGYVNSYNACQALLKGEKIKRNE